MANSPRPATNPTAPTQGANPIDERYLGAVLDAAEARTETKFAQLIGKIDLIGERIGALSGEIAGLKGQVNVIDGHTRSARTSIIVAIIGTALALAALAWGGVQIFQSGMGITATAYQTGAASNGGRNDNTEASARSQGSEPVRR